MKRNRYTAFLAVVIFCAGILTQCELVLGDGGGYNLSIDLAGSLEQTGRAIAGAPYPIASYTVTVSAPDMTTIQKDVRAGARYINMYIPYGNDRTIRLDANIDQAVAIANNREHLLSLAGETTVDLVPGRVVMCRLFMHTGNMKLIVPENGVGLPSGKIVRIPNMTPSPTDWTERTQLTNSSTGSLQNIKPWEVDFDSTGRIFFTDRFSTALVRIDEIDPAGTTGLFFSPGSNNTLAIDYINDAVYYDAYAGTNQLFRCDLNFSGGAIVSPQPTNLGSFRSMQFDSGILYILGTPVGNSTPLLVRYIPATGITTHSYLRSSPTDPYFTDPRDILIKGNYLYVANWSTGTIARFNKNTLTPIDSFGTKSSSNDDRAPGHFYGPNHFIAIYNRKFYIIDDGTAGMGFSYDNRIIAFDEIGTWSGWETFRSEDIGQAPFTFYEC